MILTKIRQYSWAFASVLSALLVGAFLLIGVLWWRLDQTSEDLERVESSTAIFALQVQTVREQLTELGPKVSDNLDQAIAGLNSLTEAPLELPIQLEESIGIKAQIPLKQNLVVPVDLILPIEEPIQTTIQVEGPWGIAVPVQVRIPRGLEIPIATEVIVPLDVTVPMEAQVPVRIDTPVRLDFRETELAGSVESLLELLIEIRMLLAKLN